MTYETYTTIKASPEFWQNKLSKHIIGKTDSKVTTYDDGEIIITSRDCTAEPDIIEFSRNNPDELIVAKYSGENKYANLTSTYEYKAGVRSFIKEEYEYYFVIPAVEKEIIGVEVYEHFKDKATEQLKKIDKYRVRTSESSPSFQENPIDEDEFFKLTPCLKVILSKIQITAKKFGLTRVDVAVKYLDDIRNP